MTDADTCRVWWAHTTDSRPTLADLLSPVERERVDSLRRGEDQTRRVLATALLRLAVQSRTGIPAREVTVERTCPRCGKPHWRPTLPGTGLHASVTHSGDWVAVALTTVGPVGVDVERVTAVDVAGLSRTVLHPDERGLVHTHLDFFRYWTRKEAVVKATGEGLGASLPAVRVSGPDEPPALLGYPGDPDLAAHLVDLVRGDGYTAALAILVDRPVAVAEHLGSTLFT